MTASRLFHCMAVCTLLLAGSGLSFTAKAAVNGAVNGAGNDPVSDPVDDNIQLAAKTTRAEFSYRRLYELLYQFRDWQFHDLPAETTSQLRFAIRLRSTDGTIPGELAVHIEYGKRRIDVPVDEFGILDLPVSPQLANVNAPVVTNQPEGTIEMGLAIIIQQPGKTELDINELLNGIEQVNAAMQARSRLSPGRTPRAIGITVKFAGDSRGSVIIKGATDEVDYRADDYNTVDIPLDTDAPPDSIRITDQPLVIFPLFEE